MGPTAGLRPAAAYDDAVLHDDRADRRIGPGAPEAAAPERQGKRHEAGVIGIRDGLDVVQFSAASALLIAWRSLGTSLLCDVPATRHTALLARRNRVNLKPQLPNILGGR
jgi:hypothetical protein